MARAKIAAIGALLALSLPAFADGEPPADGKTPPAVDPLAPPPVTPPDSTASATPLGEYDRHRAAGFDAVAAQNYRLALRELSAAYASRKSPDLLLAIGEAHRRLGHGRDAVAFFRGYLESSSVSDEESERITAEIARIERLNDQAQRDAPAVPRRRIAEDERLVPVRYEKRLDRGLFFSGLSLGIAGYLPSLIGGAIVGSQGICCGADRGHAQGLVLLIPVAGPFVSGIVSRDGTWAGGWILTTGVLQAIGLTLIVVGSRRLHDVPVIVSPTVNSTGAGLSLGGSF